MKMKYLGILVLSVLFVGLIASSAFALTNSGVVDRGIAIEKISPTAGFIDERGIGAPIAVAVDVGLAAGDQVSFRLSGGATFNNPATLKLCDDGTTGIGGNDDVDLSAGGATLTVSDNGATLTFTLSAPEAAGSILYVARQCNTAATVPYYGPQIVIPAGMRSTQVIRLTTATNSLTEAPATDTDTIYSAFQQFTTTGATGFRWIDVNKDLLRFDGLAATELQSRTMVGSVISNNAVAGDIQAINISNVQVTFRLTGDMTGVSSITLVPTGSITPIAEFAIGNGVATASVGLSGIIGTAYDILVTIDSSTIKDDRAFDLSITIAPANDVVQGVTLVDSTQTVASPAGRGNFVLAGKRNLVWQINGTQFIVPYTRNDDNLGIRTAIRLENVTGSNRNYWLLVNNPDTGKWTMIRSKQPISQGAVVWLWANDIMEWARNATTPVNLPTTGFATRIVVDEINNPQNVAAYATQSLGGNFRHIQVLKNAGWTD